jgi:hypothetical protein
MHGSEVLVHGWLHGLMAVACGEVEHQDREAMAGQSHSPPGRRKALGTRSTLQRDIPSDYSLPLESPPHCPFGYQITHRVTQ